jgi:transcriptional regulator with XRE-family HTH domain
MIDTAMPENKAHEGRNVKRIREILGIKQDTLAFDLGLSQQAISQLEQRGVIDPKLLEQVAKILKVTPEAIRNFNEEAAFNFINNFNDNSINHGPLNNYHCTFNPLDKVVELYERMLKEKDELIEKLAGEKKK